MDLSTVLYCSSRGGSSYSLRVCLEKFCEDFSTTSNKKLWINFEASLTVNFTSCSSRGWFFFKFIPLSHKFHVELFDQLGMKKLNKCWTTCNALPGVGSSCFFNLTFLFHIDYFSTMGNKNDLDKIWNEFVYCTQVAFKASCQGYMIGTSEICVIYSTSSVWYYLQSR